VWSSGTTGCWFGELEKWVRLLMVGEMAALCSGWGVEFASLGSSLLMLEMVVLVSMVTQVKWS